MIDDPALRLLASAPPGRGTRALLLGTGGDAALLRSYAPAYQETWCHNLQQPDHARCLETAAGMGAGVHCFLGDIPCSARGVADNAREDALPETVFPEGHFDRIVMRLGRGTAQVNAALAESFRLLRPGGELLAAAGNQEGIKSFAKRAEAHFGNLELAALKASCRLLRLRKESDAPVEPVEDPGYFRYLRHSLAFPGGEIAYLTKPGVFAYRGTDAGTALLASLLPDCAGKRVLDLGCGSGPLSLAACARGAESVVAVDNNAVAVACASRNFAAAGVPAQAVCADMDAYGPGGFDLVLSNPPFHAEGATDYALPGKVAAALARLLRPGGEAWLVANQFLDYAGPARQRFQSASQVARAGGYSVHHMVMAP